MGVFDTKEIPMRFKIVSDSAANVLSLPDVAYCNVPLKIVTAQAEYVDDASLDVREMVEQIKVTKGKSGTSCPNIHDWLQAFGDATEIFAVTITSNLSGSFAAAREAAREYTQTHPGAKVHVVDSLSAGPEMALIIEQLKQWILEKLPFEQIREKITAYQKRTHLIFSLESLTNLARNGRCSSAVAKIAGVLGIRVVGVASEVGTLEPLHKCRGEKKAVETIFQIMQDRGFDGGKVRIAHCFNPDAAGKLREKILAVFPGSQILLENTTGLCSFYAELGGLMIGFESK